jgi:shikimate kinase
MKILLAGVACVGKSTIGAELASLIGVPFFDLDTEVESEIKKDMRYFARSYSKAHITVRIDGLGRAEAAKRIKAALDALP